MRSKPLIPGTPSPVPGAGLAAFDRFDWAAAAVIAGFAAFAGWFVVARHSVPLYQVETDLLGEYIPAARELLHGRIDPVHYTSKGGGYPLLLAAAGGLCGGDFWLGARLLNIAAAATVATLCYRLCRAWFNSEVALAVLLALLVNPTLVQATVEAATDLTALALALASMLCLLEAPPAASAENGGRLMQPPASRFAIAGLLAGFTVITRTNFAVLPLAAGVLLRVRRSPLRTIAAYAITCALPIAGWAMLAGHPPGAASISQNALNVAYEFYGDSMRDSFWSIGSARFHSMLDVVRFDPARFARHLLMNLGTRWTQDVTKLLTLPLGIPAVLGIFLGGWWGRRRVMIALHFVPVYVVLATVFYLPRFSLFLVPLYVCAGAWLVLDAFGSRIRARAWQVPIHAARWAVWLALLWPVAQRAIATESASLAAAPTETRDAGETLRRVTRGDAPVMASKPHVAFFAGQRYVPMGSYASYADLFEAARVSGARYLFYSMPETGKCPGFLGLLTPGAAMPGLEPVELRLEDPRHYFGLYRFTGERPTAAALDSAGIEAARRLAERTPGDLLAITTLADLLEHAGRPRDALAVLEAPARRAPDFAPIARFQALCYLDLGEADSASVAAERVIGLADATGWDWGLLGRVRSRQLRHAAAVEAYSRAVRLDPARGELRRALAREDSLSRVKAR